MNTPCSASKVLGKQLLAPDLSLATPLTLSKPDTPTADCDYCNLQTRVTTAEVSPYKFCKNGGSTSDKNFIQASTIAHLAGLATDHWSLMQRGNRRQRISSPMLPLVSRFEYTYFARRYALPRCANVTCPENRKCIAIYVHKSLSVQRKHKKTQQYNAAAGGESSHGHAQVHREFNEVGTSRF